MQTLTILQRSCSVPRPSQIDDQRKRLLPIISRAFSELGYRRTTTAELARRCQVQENILYRLWTDKKAMFLAAIDAMFEERMARWIQLLSDKPDSRTAAQRLIDHDRAVLADGPDWWKADDGR